MSQSPRIVVIGGVAAGMAAASQAKRRRPDAEVIVFERGPFVSYGACGMPYNIEDPDRSMEDLVVIPAEKFRTDRGIDVRIHSEVQSIDTDEKLVLVRNRETGIEEAQAYDKLIIATGASAIRPALRGMDLPGVFLLRELTDGRALKAYIEENNPRRAVIVGAGYIGMEMAEALTERGLAVTVLEKLDEVLPGFDRAIAEVVHQELEERGVLVQAGVTVSSIEQSDDSVFLAVETDKGAFVADMVIISVGVRPNVALAEQAGVALGSTGAIAVDDHMRTNVEDVFAAGDCAEAFHLVAGEPTYIPLGTTANKEGKVAGANAAGANESFGGIVGTAGFKVFDLEVARTGLGQNEIDRLGLEALKSVSSHKTRGHGYPGAQKVVTVLFVEKDSGKLLGAQMTGKAPVGTRVDVFAAALHARMDVDQIEGLDLVYAPPIAPVYDPILIAATVAKKDVDRAHKPRPSRQPASAEI